MTPSTTKQRSHAFLLLLARYIAGEIAEAQFEQLTTLLDTTEASSEERTALARYYLDAISNGTEINLPKAHEIKDFLTIARA